MKLLKAADHRHMPWKNGGGVTVEIAVYPEHASVDNFDWRISMATVASDGPFSIFPDIERTLSVLEGDGIILNVDSQTVELRPQSDPFSFAADSACTGSLTGTAIRDLNIMTRRGCFTHHVERREIRETETIQPSGAKFLVFCAEGSLEIGADARSFLLTQNDCIIHETDDLSSLTIDGNGIAYLITISEASTS